MNSRELKRLNRKKEELSKELTANKEQTAELQRKGHIIRNEISEIDQEIELITQADLNEDLEISDHAVVRYLERVEGIDIEQIKTKIKGTIPAIEDFENMAYLKDGHRFIVKNNKVITVTPK